MPKATETILEIDLNALAHNYQYLSSKVNPTTKILAVVKANSYGSDDVIIARELEKLGVAYFAVAYASEGLSLRDAKIETPILVLHPLPVNFDLILERCLEPSIYSPKMLREFIAFAEIKKQKNYPIHLKFNTGLNRLGFSKNEVDWILEQLEKTSSVKVKSIFSHLAATDDDLESIFTKKQLSNFRNIFEKLIANLEYTPILHTLNTSGVLNYPEAQYDMVRTGIGLYGFGNNPEENKKLKPIATLKTVISQIHRIKPGESVGYNRAYTASDFETTATLPLGHADGISRAFGNGVGWVTIKGQKASIIGNVCMDMIMVDITNIKCQEGDEVIVFGANPTAEDLSTAIKSIPYELLTNISRRIKRTIHRK
ncbi:MAG: alanine racemase [Flavobacteriaceae bacterium]|jgi:alanine racemase